MKEQKKTALEVAISAFRRCRSRKQAKNEACAPWLAKQALVRSGVLGHELREEMTQVRGYLKDWFKRRASDPDFAPNPDDYDQKREQESSNAEDNVPA